jgi:hypothetical protein
MAIHTVVGVRPGLEASVHASAWPLHLIRALRADHQHSHKRDVICLMFVCSAVRTKQQRNRNVAPSDATRRWPGRTPKIGLLRGRRGPAQVL